MAQTSTAVESVSLRLPNGTLEAALAPRDGMLVTSLRHHGTELLGPKGIPFLAPWANRLEGDHVALGGRPVDLTGAPSMERDEHGLPIHGLLKHSPLWKVFAHTNWALAAELDFGAQPSLLELFPFPHRLVMRADLGAHSLTIRTTVTAGPDEAVPVSFGFHPYFALPDVARSMWRVELPAMEHLEVDDCGIPTGVSEYVASDCFILGHRVYDDGYAGVRRGARFALSGGGRRITMRFDAGYPCAQVFAPSDDDVICFEPMTAPTNALISGDGLTWVQAGSSYTATFSISLC
ncbi:MAG TPA: aldose 1-epimerase [Solirubrobacteraceae bacterium]|nr:aldose 1-epimerase [Solirubrobacteraceae bacterium]